MTTDDATTGISETEDLTRMIVAVCNGHDPLVIGFALSTVLADLLCGQARQQVEAGRGTSRRMRRSLKRHHLEAVKAMLEPLDEAP